MDQSLKRNIYLPDEASTEVLAAEIVAALPQDLAGWMVLLQGDLGAGKSTLARGMIRTFGHTGPVPSPTYTLIEPYDILNNLIYHIDLYRISSLEELQYLGWTDLEDGLRVIEWPERVPDLLAQADFIVYLRYQGSARVAEICSLSNRGAEAIIRLSLK